MNEEDYLIKTQKRVAEHGIYYHLDYDYKWNEFHVAVLHGMFLTVQWLFNQNPSLARMVDHTDHTPLHFAGTPSMARYLLVEGKADLFAKNADGETPNECPVRFDSMELHDYLKLVEERWQYLNLFMRIETLPKDLWRELMSYLTQ